MLNDNEHNNDNVEMIGYSGTFSVHFISKQDIYL